MDDSQPVKSRGGRPRIAASKVTRPVALSLRPQAIADLAAIRKATGESGGDVVGRLLSNEWKRISRREGRPGMIFADFARAIHDRALDAAAALSKTPIRIALVISGREARILDERHGIEFVISSGDGRSAFAVARSTIDPTKSISPTMAVIISESAIEEIARYIEEGLSNPALRHSDRDLLVALTDRIRALGLMENLQVVATVDESFAVMNPHWVRWQIVDRFRASGMVREDGAISISFVDRGFDIDFVRHVIPYLVTEDELARAAGDVAHWVVAGIDPMPVPPA